MRTVVFIVAGLVAGVGAGCTTESSQAENLPIAEAAPARVPASISGRVVDQLDRPAAGAVVVASCRRDTREAVTAADGSFVIESLLGGCTYEVAIDRGTPITVAGRIEPLPVLDRTTLDVAIADRHAHATKLTLRVATRPDR
jgi:hypothetical protein